MKRRVIVKKYYSPGEVLKEKGVQIQLLKIKAGETAKEHYHKIQTEIFYFINNNGYFIINGKTYKIRAGDVIVIEPNDKHIVVNDSLEDFIYVGFKLHLQENDSYWN